MAKVYYKLSNKVQDNGKCNIIVWFRANRTLQVQIQTSYAVLPKYFIVMGTSGGTNYGEIKVPNKGKLNYADVKETADTKTGLQDFTNKLLKVCEVVPSSELTKEFIKSAVGVFDSVGVHDMTFAKLNRLIEAKSKAIAEKSIFAYTQQFLSERNLAQSEVRNYNVLMRTLHRWQEYRKSTSKDKKFRIEYNTLCTDDIADFRDYMRNESELQKDKPELFKKMLLLYPVEVEHDKKCKHINATIQERGENYLIKMLTRFKTFWLWLVKRGVTTNNPFASFEVGSPVYGLPYYLTIEERNTLAEFDLSSRPQLEVQRDIFVFQCLVGCRVSDLIKLTQANITNNILEYVPIKTKDNAKQVKPRIPLNARAQSLIKKYEGVDRKGRLFPFISAQKYNQAIKEAFKVCGITRNVPVRNSLTGNTEIKPLCEVASSHMARRTFVGTAYSKVQDPNLIGKMSGHVEGSRAFARYRAITDDLLQEVINLID